MNPPRRGSTNSRGQADRHVDAQAAGQASLAAAEHAAQVVVVVQHVAAARMEGRAFLRQLDPARGPLQQPRAQLLLELAHGGGDRRVRQAELARGAAEALEFGDLQKDAGSYRVRSWLHDSS
jgi:hypothetical protein